MAAQAANTLAIPPGRLPGSSCQSSNGSAGGGGRCNDLVFRRPSSRRLVVAVPRSACPSSRVERRQKKCGPSEEALIHHTSLAACHLNAKYLQRIFKTKTRKEMSGGGRREGGREGGTEG